MHRYLFVLTLTALIAGVSNADSVIDFQSLEREDANFEVFGDEYLEDGFVLSEANGGSLGTVGTLEPRYSGSTAVAGSGANSVYVLTKDGGGVFGVNSIDLAEFSADENGSTTVNFTGILSQGGVAFQSFTLDGTSFSPETFSFNSDFDSVVALVWLQSNPEHQFDNINVSAIPEPTASAILIVGFAFCSRRKR